MNKASVIWLNYNSMKFINLVLSSLKSVFDLDYKNFEVIIVDNASTDGSFEAIKRFIDELKPKQKVKFIQSDRNRGYSGGMNLGFASVDLDSKYAVFLNNDLVVNPQSLSAIIEYMETDEEVAATSGLIFYGDGKTIYSAGGIVTELGNAGGVCWMTELAECPSSLKKHYVTYADGAYMVVKTHIIRRMSHLGKPFLDEAFLYFDDYVLGLMLWNRGYKVMYYPVKAGLHYAHKTTKPVINYYGVRAHLALMRILKSRLAPLSIIHILRRLAVHSGLCLAGVAESCSLVRAIYDGFRLASKAEKKLGPLILYRAPHVASRINELKCHTLGLCKEPLKISHSDIRYLS